MSLVPTGVMLDRVAADLESVIRALGMMSQIQFQQGRQLADILALLTPDPSRTGPDLAEILVELVAVTKDMGMKVGMVSGQLARATDSIPRQMARAIDEAAARAAAAALKG